MTREPTEIVLGLALAVVLGGLVGLERERHSHTEGKPSFAGARTFPLVALLGALSALLAQSMGAAVWIASFAAVSLLVAVGYARSRDEEGRVQHGLTTEFSALLIFAIAGLPFAGPPSLSFQQSLLLAAALGTVVMTLLALRRPIHAFAENLSQEDLLATVRFALVAVVALPLMPDRSYGPFGVLNPYRIGVVIVLIAAISFVGYIAVRLLGARRGIGVAAVAGGLVSSTAVTLTFSAKGKEHPELSSACALACALAGTVMIVRALIEIFAIRRELLAGVAPPLLGMLLASGLGCLFLWRRSVASAAYEEPRGLRNPFQLRQALRLGLVYAAIRFAAAAAWDRFGEGGLLLSSAVAGLADVDAIILSVARMHEQGLEERVAVTAVTIAVATNTVVKVFIAAALGGRRMAVLLAAVMLPAAAVGAAIAFVYR
jgi:uncharacterized membrane protein (DUF4010 family)